MKYMILMKGPPKENQPPIIPAEKHPGKFEGEIELCSVLWEAAGSWGEIGIGNESEMGWYAVPMELGPGVAKELEPIAQEVMGRHLTQAERRFIGEQYGVIMEETDVGFVTCIYYTSEYEYDRYVEALQADEEAFYSGQEDEDGGDEDNPMGFSSVIGSASRVVAKEVPYG